MKHFSKLFSAIAGTVMLGISVFATACGGASANAFKLGHYDGSDTSKGYDTSMLYKNNSELWGGDSGVIWVSEEEGEELKNRGIVDENGESYGGYFYQYMSSCSGSASYGVQIDEPNFGRGTSYFVTTRSPDLNDWKICGEVDQGMALFVGENEWLYNLTWAPEVAHIPFDMTVRDYDGNEVLDENGNPQIAPYAGKYIIYFSGKPKSWTPKLGSYGAFYGIDAGGLAFNSFSFGIAVSDSPAGPFRLVSSENFYGDPTATQPVTKDFAGNDYYGMDDGIHGKGVITGYNPAVWFEDVGKGSKDMDDHFAMIDLSPFIDDDGTMYMVFVKHTTDRTLASGFAAAAGNSVWIMRMVDPVTPDFASLRKAVNNTVFDYNDPAYPDQKMCTSIVWKGDAKIASGEMTMKEALEAYPVWRDYPIYVDPTHKNGNYDVVEGKECPYDFIDTFEDGTKFWSDVKGINDNGCAEGPNLFSTTNKDGEKRYIIVYAPIGVGWDLYDFKWAYTMTDNPISPYMKPKENRRFLLGYDDELSHMTALGHGQVVWAGDETWFAHWEGDRPHTPDANPGRIYAVTQATWQYEEEYDLYIPIANGPSTTLQPKPQVSTGYTNVAPSAKVTATNAVDKDKIKYLNDGMVVATVLRDDQEFAFKKSTVITLTFDKAVAIRGILIYNSYHIENAFKDIARINFTLAEEPEWYGGDGTKTSCYIKNLGFAPSYSPLVDITTSACTASVATFDEIKVTKIEITIDKAYGDNEEIRISDINVLGRYLEA